MQDAADARYDFVVDGDATSTVVRDARFEVRSDGLTVSRDGWTGGIALVDVGRGGDSSPLAAGHVVVDGNESIVDHGALVERWVSGPLGVEQLVEIAARPQGDGELVFGIGVSGDASPTLVDDAIELRDRHARVRARYSDLYVADARGRGVPAHFAVRGSRIELRVEDTDAEYPLIVDPLVGAEQAHLFSSSPTASDFFGVSVAFDGTTAVVGASLAETSVPNSGAAFVFTRSGTSWSAPIQLVASDAASNDQFGASVALSGNTIVVGAPRADNGAITDTGQAYVFVSSGGVWTEQARFRPVGGLTTDRFGNSVSIDGDTIVVGASSADTLAGTNSGAAYVYTRSGTTWTFQTRLTASDAAMTDVFGTAVCLNAGTVAITASLDDVGAAIDAGSAYIFTGSGATWTQEAHLTPSDAASASTFGSSCSLQGNRLAIGSTFYAGGGHAYVFDRSGTTWTQQPPLTPPAGTTSLGASIALDGSTLAVGATNGSGAVIIYGLAGGVWSQTGRVVAADGVSGDSLGNAVALVGDTVLAGASQDDTPAGMDAGSAYVELLRSANGDPCTSGATCATGICVDGVCCNVACAGGTTDCQACSVAAGAAMNGTCSPLASTTVCRAAASTCDMAETCDGVSAACPADMVAPAGTTCRASAGACDVADSCDGVTGGCTDNRVTPGTVCRAAGANATCDPAETCVASDPACPADTNTDGTSCADSLTCNGAEVCAAGTCPAATPLSCDDGNACTADMCAEPGGCAHSPIAGCCSSATDCDDGDPCTTDACTAMACVHTDTCDAGTMNDAGLPMDDAGVDAAISVDAGPRDAGPDAGRDASADGSVIGADVGTMPPAAASCGCTAAGTGDRSAVGGLGLLGLALVLVRRRRR